MAAAYSKRACIFCDTIFVVIPGQCFIYDHTKIFRVVLLYEYVAVKRVLFVFGVTGTGYMEGIIFLGMELHLPCFFPLGQFV